MNAVVVGPLNDRDVIVSGSNDRTVRIWDAAGHSLADPTYLVEACMACGCRTWGSS